MHGFYEAPNTIIRMLFTAQQLLYTMTPTQRDSCEYPLEHPARFDWDFIPKPDRSGIPLWQLDRHQRVLAQTLVKSGLSMRGYTQALEIMAMENVLRELEVERLGLIAGDFRHPDAYFLSFFGRPGFEDTWAWRFLGHHLSLSYTIIGQRWLSVTPCNMGAQPAEMGTISPLREDEDLGFMILNGVSNDQRRKLVIHDVAPADYVTRQVPRVGKVEYPDHIDLGIPWYSINDADREALKFEKDLPRGMSGLDLPVGVRTTLTDLVESFVRRMPDEVADRHMERIKGDGLENLWFAWAGGQEKGTPHYYRIQGREILIEFDNAIDNGNHIHSIWRDYRNDLGHELLLDHYENERHHGHHLDTRLKSSVPDE
jgi:Protein of unknown function (DUF3500)